MDRLRMDRVKFDAVMEIIARILKQKSDEVIETKKVLLKGGLMRFDTARLVNDLEQMIEEIEMYAPQGFVETYPRGQDEGEPGTTE
jgi:hypothetical protein